MSTAEAEEEAAAEVVAEVEEEAEEEEGVEAVEAMEEEVMPHTIQIMPIIQMVGNLISVPTAMTNGIPFLGNRNSKFMHFEMRIVTVVINIRLTIDKFNRPLLMALNPPLPNYHLLQASKFSASPLLQEDHRFQRAEDRQGMHSQVNQGLEID